MSEISRMLNAFKASIAAMIAQQSRPRYGIVESFDPGAYMAKVSIQPEGELTGWLPILSPWIGNGWGMFCPPSVGDQVKIIPQEADGDSYAIIGRAYSLEQAPLSVPSGEFWLVHSTGSTIRLLNDGSISSSGTWNHDGAFNATGDVVAGSGGSDSVTLQGHTHKQGDDGHGDTEVPTDAPTAGT